MPKSRNQVIRRLLVAMRAMQTGRPTLSDLAEQMDCTERTARRYIESLEQANYTVRRHGPHYRIEGHV